MVQELTTQPTIFGRLGKGISKGLSEVVPQEVNRQRLSSGLQQFEKDYSNLSPVQQLARLSAIPGVTPQMIQTFGELARLQNQRSAFGRLSNTAQQPKFSSDLSAVPYAGSDTRSVSQSIPNQTPIPTQEPTAQIVNENPIQEKFLSRPPWSPQQRNDRINQYLNEGFLPEQAQSLASDDESRDLNSPKAYQERYEQLRQRQKEARDEFGRQLERKIQKKGPGVFEDITGEMLNNLERGLQRDLRLNPKANVEDVANDWSNRALNLAKTKKQLEKTAATTGIENFLKGDEALKKLQQHESIFKKAGNSEEYFNLLKSLYGLSPQGAASIAYPANKKLKNFISSFKPASIDESRDRRSLARRAAVEVENHLTGDDSILSILRDLRIKDPTFDQQEFLNQLSEDQDELRLNERQRREIAEGPSSILPTWGDILIFPLLRR